LGWYRIDPTATPKRSLISKIRAAASKKQNGNAVPPPFIVAVHLENAKRIATFQIIRNVSEDTMGLISTLSKVALGVVIAKGVDHVSRNGMPKLGKGGLGSGGIAGMLENLGGSSRADAQARAPHNNSLGGMLTKIGGPNLNGLLGKPDAAPDLNPVFNQAIIGHEIPEPSRDQQLAAALMLRAMVQAAMADGTLDEKERAKLMQHMSDATRDEVAFVAGLMDQPVDIAALAADVPDGMEEQIYLISLVAIDLDSHVEAQYLHNLAGALGLGKAVINDIHSQAGLPLLYA
jgi:uncharacterized membrane protein YebE (DUF533 family)